MNPRMKNPVVVIPEAMAAIQKLNEAVSKSGVPSKTLDLVHLRASQINGCTTCIAAGTSSAQKCGESDERLVAVARWRNSTGFSVAERAALALAEAVTRLSDRDNPVPDEIWEEAARHYDERALAGLVLSLATTNLFNRLNVATKQEPGQW